ncbi:MAG: hypothetical protein RIB43_05690 [Rhodospirillaceae bacterium]
MSEDSRRGAHWSFWLVGAVALIWNGLGSVNYLVQVNADSLDAYRAVEQAIIADRPAWATGAFAMAMFGGTVGGLLLLMRKAVAFQVFIVSFVGVMVTTAHTIGVDADFGAGEAVVIVLMPIAVAAFFVWYAKRAKARGWVS